MLFLILFLCHVWANYVWVSRFVTSVKVTENLILGFCVLHTHEELMKSLNIDDSLSLLKVLSGDCPWTSERPLIGTHCTHVKWPKWSDCFDLHARDCGLFTPFLGRSYTFLLLTSFCQYHMCYGPWTGERQSLNLNCPNLFLFCLLSFSFCSISFGLILSLFLLLVCASALYVEALASIWWTHHGLEGILFGNHGTMSLLCTNASLGFMCVMCSTALL